MVALKILYKYHVFSATIVGQWELVTTAGAIQYVIRNRYSLFLPCT
ncbi:MAG: hypothetical protein WBL02_05270 [Methanomethylovorans sp.]